MTNKESPLYKEVYDFATEKLEAIYSNQDSDDTKKILEYMIPKSTQNIIQFIESTGYELSRVLSYVEGTGIDNRVDRSHIYMKPSIMLCKKLGINEGYAMNIKRYFDLMRTIHEGDVLPQQCMVLNEKMVEQELSGETKDKVLESIKEKKDIDNISLLLFTLYDYQTKNGEIFFSPQKALEEFTKVCGMERVQENRKKLIDMCHFFVLQHRKSDKNTESLDLYKDILSPTGMKRFINRYSLRMLANNEEQLRIYREVYEHGGIDRNPNDYRHFVEMSLDDLKIQDSSIITDIEQKKLTYQNRYRDIVLRNIIDDRCGNGLQIRALDHRGSEQKESHKDIQRPRDIEEYTDDIFLVHKKEILKEIQIFAQNELFMQKATSDKIRGISLLKNKIEQRLTHMNGLMTFLEDCGKMEKNLQTKTFPHLKKIRYHIINRPFDIQQNFFAVSHDLIGEYPEIYEELLQRICDMSKQNRKHVVQDIFPELHTNINLIQSMNIKIKDKEQTESPYKIQIKEFIEHIMESEGNTSGTYIDDIKKEYIQNHFHLANTDIYVREKKQMMEYFIRYSCNINGMNEKRLAQIGAMASLHHNNLWKQRRVDHTIEIPDMTDEGKSILAEEENDGKYREQHIAKKDLLALQETTSFTTAIKPQTPTEKIYTIQESFESIYDPDIYTEEVKPLAKKFFESREKSVIMESLSEEEKKLAAQIPIVNFITHIEKLRLEETRNEIESKQTTPEKIQQAKNTINQAREIFRNIVRAYKNITSPESVDIRLEEIANNFALEINELDRSMEEMKGIDEEVRLTSHISADMQEVIPNIRGCLGCLSKSGFNDKNLDFQNPNRFLIVSYPDGPKEKSIADQILLILPSDRGPCLVMDKLYGFRSLDILINHSLNVMKKAASIEKPINVFIPKTSIDSAGTKISTYFKALQTVCKEYFPEAHIDKQPMKFEGTYAGYNECSLKNEGENEGIFISLSG